MIFLSKKDVWMGLIMWVSIAGFLWVLYESIFIQFDLLGIIIMPLLICLLLSIWFHTRYTIEQDLMKISYGPVRKQINITDIISIRETTNLFVAPALSMKRLEIYYGKYGTIAISPKDKKKFIEVLQKKNQRIQIKN